MAPVWSGCGSASRRCASSRRSPRTSRRSCAPRAMRRRSRSAPARALGVGVALAAWGVAGVWIAWALDAMLVADAALLAAVWLDARRAVRLGEGGLTVAREAPPAFSLGRAGEVSYHWRNTAPHQARLRLREVRPELLGGTQPPRVI